MADTVANFKKAIVAQSIGYGRLAWGQGYCHAVSDRFRAALRNSGSLAKARKKQPNKK
jgi:hypothetical protein